MEEEFYDRRGFNRDDRYIKRKSYGVGSVVLYNQNGRTRVGKIAVKMNNERYAVRSIFSRNDYNMVNRRDIYGEIVYGY